jgi:carboxypeptidase Taq
MYSEMSALRAASSLMHWDQATYLPENAGPVRGRHLATLSKILHERATAPEIGHCLDALEKHHFDADSDEACFIRVARRNYENLIRLPADFMAEQSHHQSHSYELWRKARAENNFGAIVPILEKTLDLSRREAEYLRRPHQKSVIDPLIDGSDRGFDEATLRPLFATLRARLVPLLERIASRPAIDNSCLLQNFPESEQLKFGEFVIRRIGYDFTRGRQDRTTHPFMIRFAHDDIRITTRVRDDDVSDAFFSTLHEAGHALYEQGIDPAFDGTPLGHGASSGIHESQSRFWENIIGRSIPFWRHFYPELQKAFPRQLGSVPLEVFHRAINRVQKSLIRTDADEVSYNLHVMIRFDLECDLLNGKLAVRDLADAWNARYQSDLGLTPQTASEGVLQDVHWFFGSIGGAFQGYTIGNVFSGQLYATALNEIPDFEARLERGDLLSIREWLRNKLHRYGAKFEGPDLIRKVCGQDLNAEPYLRYLETKYESLMR